MNISQLKPERTRSRLISTGSSANPVFLTPNTVLDGETTGGAEENPNRMHFKAELPEVLLNWEEDRFNQEWK